MDIKWKSKRQFFVLLQTLMKKGIWSFLSFFCFLFVDIVETQIHVLNNICEIKLSPSTSKPPSDYGERSSPIERTPWGTKVIFEVKIYN